MGSLYENPTEENIILEAKRNSEGFYPINSLIDALENFYMNGTHDDCCGTVESGCHYYRVNRWIVQTDSQGFHEVFSYDSEKEAKIEFGKIDAAIGAEYGEEDVSGQIFDVRDIRSMNVCNNLIGRAAGRITFFSR